MMKHSVILMVLALVFLASCYYDNEASLYPPSSNSIDTTGGGGCDTSNVTYAATIAPLVSQRCLPACHSATTFAASGGNVNLDGYNNIKIYAGNGRLLGATTHSQGYVPMPNDNTTLTSCQVAYFRVWIRAGFANN
ncbi:MAG: hypothetical protein JSS75_02115 [Bacteroidetes bacterium]|nr:hypothetical protein [Bacteroidota bacterium]